MTGSNVVNDKEEPAMGKSDLRWRGVGVFNLKAP
jgi:hypothetical protein